MDLKLNVRKEIVYKQLKLSHMAGNKPMPSNETEIMFLIDNWSNMLKAIKDDDLKEAFSNAIVDCRYAVPSVKEVLKGAMKANETSFNRKNWAVTDAVLPHMVMTAGGVPMVKGTYDTIHTMPITNQTENMKHLLDKNRKGTLTAEEAIEFQNLEKMKFWVEDQTVNKKYQEVELNTNNKLRSQEWN